jgi:hypothetical protein
MKALLTLTFAISLFLVSPASAQLRDVEFTVTRQKLDEQKEREGGNTTITTKEVRYKVTAQNRTFKTIPELKIKYMVFYEAPQPGSHETVEAFHKGSEVITNFEGNRTSIFETKPFKLTTEQLDGGWVYTSGAKNKAKDRVVGIWIKAYSEDKLVGEYVNPSTLARKNEFKE